MDQNSWKFIFSDFRKTNFFKFFVIFGLPTVHHFYEGLQFRAEWRHFSLKCLRMPSFCPILESSIKVMHRRMAKNDQKFTKNCFCRELSLKSGKIIFYEFWMIFGHSTVHHLKKTPKNTWNSRKNPISWFFWKIQDFLPFLYHIFEKNS